MYLKNTVGLHMVHMGQNMGIESIQLLEVGIEDQPPFVEYDSSFDIRKS